MNTPDDAQLHREQTWHRMAFILCHLIEYCCLGQHFPSTHKKKGKIQWISRKKNIKKMCLFIKRHGELSRVCIYKIHVCLLNNFVWYLKGEGGREPELKSTACVGAHIWYTYGIYFLAAQIVHTPHCAPYFFLLYSLQTLDAIAATLQGRPETRLLWRCGRPNWRVSVARCIFGKRGVS